MIKSWLAPVILILSSNVVWGQNLLFNPSFTEAPVIADCLVHDQDGPFPGWTSEGHPFRANGSFFIPPCPADNTYAGWQESGGMLSGRVYQTATVPMTDGVQAYRFSGKYVLGTKDATNGVSAKFHIYAGAPPLGFNGFKRVTITKKNGEMSNWGTFNVTGVPAAGLTQLTVAIDFQPANAGDNALHVDDLEFVPTICAVQPAVTAVAPTRAIRGTTVSMVLTGTGFSGTPTVQLSGPVTINANSVTVNSATQVTAQFTIPADAPPAAYDLTYDQGGDCGTVTFLDALLVYSSTFLNPGFESPASFDCGVVPANRVAPEGWRSGESGSWGFENRLQLNGRLAEGPLLFLPTCPLVDGGKQYGTFATQAGLGAAANAYQTVAVTQGSRYTLSGFFAGSGLCETMLKLTDGDVGASQSTSKVIYAGTGNYGWTFNHLSRIAGTDMMTVEWRASAMGNGTKATHADALSFEACTTPVTSVDSISPTSATASGIVQATIIGSGFTGTPTVFLNKPGSVIPATAVTVINPNQITCNFDMTGKLSGRYALFVKQGGCVGELPNALSLLGAAFVNGDFEDPAAPQNCGPTAQPVPGVPTGWNTDSDLLRDGNAPAVPSCPSPAGGHYATLSSETGGTLRAWKTIEVTPGQPYKFSGQFAGSADCVISLLNGDEQGTTLASTTVFTDGSGEAWMPGSVSATATSNIMTIMWQMQNVSAETPGGHADGLQFGSDCPPNWADTDDDGDVDMVDFAEWQRCVNIPGGTPYDSPHCRCFDRAPPYGQIDAADFPAFSFCMSGPNIPWTSCDP